MFLTLLLYGLQGGDNAGALKAYELMQSSGFQRAVTSATFNKLIQSASQTKGLESALQVGDLSKQQTLKAMIKNDVGLVLICQSLTLVKKPLSECILEINVIFLELLVNKRS